MKLFLLLTISAGAFASPLIIQDAIPLSGSGSWFHGLDQNGSTVSAYGAFEGHSVSLSYQSCFGGPDGLFASTGGGCSYDMSTVGANVDDIVSHFFSFSLYGGTGSLSLFDDLHNLLASAVLTGQIVETSHDQSSPYQSQGTFTIATAPPTQLSRVVPNPEPGTFLFLGIGALFMGAKGIACRSRNRQPGGR